MSDTIIVMKEGSFNEIGRPTDIYNEPEMPFVADFIGEATYPARSHDTRF